MPGTHYIKAWSSTQSLMITLSSGEAESLGVAKATAVSLVIKSMPSDMGLEASVHVLPDATVAIGLRTAGALGKYGTWPYAAYGCRSVSITWILS